MADAQALAKTAEVDLEGRPEPDPPNLILALMKTRHGEEKGDDAPAASGDDASPGQTLHAVSVSMNTDEQGKVHHIRTEVDEDLCQRSCGIFSHTNPMRRVCFNVMVHPAFDNFIMLLILANAIVMGMPSREKMIRRTEKQLGQGGADAEIQAQIDALWGEKYLLEMMEVRPSHPIASHPPFCPVSSLLV